MAIKVPPTLGRSRTWVAPRNRAAITGSRYPGPVVVEAVTDLCGQQDAADSGQHRAGEQRHEMSPGYGNPGQACGNRVASDGEGVPSGSGVFEPDPDEYREHGQGESEVGDRPHGALTEVDEAVSESAVQGVGAAISSLSPRTSEDMPSVTMKLSSLTKATSIPNTRPQPAAHRTAISTMSQIDRPVLMDSQTVSTRDRPVTAPNDRSINPAARGISAASARKPVIASLAMMVRSVTCVRKRFGR